MELVNQKQPLPNSAAVLVLGILSIILGCGTFGLILGIIGLVISKDGKQLYFQNPDKYTGYGNLNAGRIMCIVGIVIGGLAAISVLFWIAIGSAILGSLIGLGSL
jgi:hypothetical protein